MTDDLSLAKDPDVYEAVPLDIVQESVTNRATIGRKRRDGEHLSGAFCCLIALIVLCVVFAMMTAWEMRLLPTSWLHEERVPERFSSNLVASSQRGE